MQVDYRKYVTVNLATAHPHYDAAGNVFNIGTAILDKGKTRYMVFKIPAAVPGGSLWEHSEARVAPSEECQLLLMTLDSI